MKARHVKLVWGASRVIRGRWYLGLFGLYDRVEGKHEDGLAISLRGVLLWLLAAAIATYLAGATALFWIWERNPYSLLKYSDALFYPFRRTELQVKKGQAFIAQGTDFFLARKYHDAANLLRLGLARQPRDFRARQMLAQYYLMANQRPAALRVLQDGLTDDYPGRPYLETYCGAAEQGEDQEAILQVCARYEAHLRASGPVRDYRWLIARQFGALGAAGKWNDALALAVREGPGDTGSEHRVLALLALGRPDDAVAFLAEWGARPGVDAAAVTRLRVRALREAKRFDEMETAIRELRAMAPAEPAAAVYGIVQRVLAAREAEADAAFKDYLFRFGGAAANLKLLADPLAEVGDLSRLQRCVAAAAERGYVLGPFNVLLVQTLVQRGEWAAAGRLLAAIPPATGREAVQTQLWRDWINRLIDAAATPAEPAQLALLEFLRARPWPIAMFRRSIEVLQLAGRLETAQDAIAAASRGFPTSTWVQAQATRVSAALAAKKPATPEVAVATTRLPAEKNFFQLLDAAVEERKWDAAAELVRQATTARPSPAWVQERAPNLRLAQVRISQGTGDFTATVAAARLFLNGDNERSRQLLEVAQAFFDRGDKTSAIALANEILRRSPGYAPVKRTLAEWQPPPPSAAPASTSAKKK